MNVGIPVFIFLTVLFLCVGLFSALRERKLKSQILKRLGRNFSGPSGPVDIEKKERVSDVPLLERIFKKISWIEKFQNFILQSALSPSPIAIVLLSLLLGLIVFILTLAFSWRGPVTILLPPAAATFPFMVVAFKRRRRFHQFAEAFPDAVSRMSSSLRAGYSLQMAFEAVVEDSASIVSKEFKYVVAELEIGQSFEEALKQMLRRIDTPELRLFISSVLLQRESGGNLAELLDNLEMTLRSRFELQRELDAASAQGKLSGLVLSFLPLFVGLAVFMIHQDYILFFFQDTVGKKLFWLCLIGQTLGFYSIRKIVSISL